MRTSSAVRGSKWHRALRIGLADPLPCVERRDAVLTGDGRCDGRRSVTGRRSHARVVQSPGSTQMSSAPPCRVALCLVRVTAASSMERRLVSQVNIATAGRTSSASRGGVEPAAGSADGGRGCRQMRWPRAVSARTRGIPVSGLDTGARTATPQQKENKTCRGPWAGGTYGRISRQRTRDAAALVGGEADRRRDTRADSDDGRTPRQPGNPPRDRPAPAGASGPPIRWRPSGARRLPRFAEARCERHDVGVALPATRAPDGRVPRSSGSRRTSRFRAAIRFGTTSPAALVGSTRVDSCVTQTIIRRVSAPSPASTAIEVPRRQENGRGSLRCLRTRTSDPPRERGMCSAPRDGKARSGESHPRVEPLLYRPAEAAAALGVSRSKVYELMNRGEIPWVQVGGARRVPVEALRQLIRTRVVDRTRRGRR